MSDPNVAWAQFQALRSHPPSSDWDERDVSRFHEIVTALEEAYNGLDLSAFRIPDSEMRPHVLSFSRASYSRRHPPRPPRMSEMRYCEGDVAKQKLEGIPFYFQSLQPPPPEPQRIGFR